VYTLDTHAIISYLDDDPAVVSVLDPLVAQDMALCVSVVTELTLLSYPSLTEENMADIAWLLASMVVFPLESHRAHLAAALRRPYRLKTPDSVVAATALLTRTPLVTRNIQDFQAIAGLSLLPISPECSRSPGEVRSHGISQKRPLHPMTPSKSMPPGACESLGTPACLPHERDHARPASMLLMAPGKALRWGLVASLP